MRRTFAAPAHQVDVVRSGAEGLQCVRTEPPDVILLDLRLPDQSGMEVYQAIRRIDARIPVIFITMAKTADTAIEAMQQGAFDYLFKPLDLGQLRRVVGEALDAARGMHAPAVITQTAPSPDMDGAIIGISAHARGLQGNRPGFQPERPGADYRREWHRQGAGRPRDLSAQCASSVPLPDPQLRGDSGKPSGKRAVRP